MDRPSPPNVEEISRAWGVRKIGVSPMFKLTHNGDHRWMKRGHDKEMYSNDSPQGGMNMKQRILTTALVPLALATLLGAQNRVYAEALSIVQVSAPEVNCRFDPSCTVVVNDFVTDFAWSSSSNDAFLQSRTWPQGVPGTPAAGLYAYLYRIDLSKSMAVTHFTCVTSFRLPFGPVEAVDYTGGGTAHQVFVISTGGLGSIALASAEKSGNNINFTFAQPLCNGGQPGKGGMSFFFGLASKSPSREVVSTLSRDIGPSLSLKAVAPKIWVTKKPPKLKHLQGRG
jgi:hypothetical protein